MTDTADDMFGDMDTESSSYLSAESAFELLGDSWYELPVEPPNELPCDSMIGLLSELPNADACACLASVRRSVPRAVVGLKTGAN